MIKILSVIGISLCTYIEDFGYFGSKSKINCYDSISLYNIHVFLVTIPKGNISKRVGDTVKILCVIREEFVGSRIDFYYDDNDQKVEKNYLTVSRFS